jgi:hypothetical protein
MAVHRLCGAVVANPHNGSLFIWLVHWMDHSGLSPKMTPALTTGFQPTGAEGGTAQPTGNGLSPHRKLALPCWGSRA